MLGYTAIEVESHGTIPASTLCSSVRPGEIESRSNPEFRFDPDTTRPALNDPLAQRETNARPWIFRLLMQTFENDENLDAAVEFAGQAVSQAK